MSKLLEDSQERTRFSSPQKVLIVLGVLLFAILLGEIGYLQFSARGQFQWGDKKTKKLSTITPAQINEIEIWKDESANNRLSISEINSIESKALFAEAMNDLSFYSPNHDRRMQEFFIRMYGSDGEKYEFDVWLKDYDSGVAYMHLVDWKKTDGRIHMLNLGGRKSKGLFKWLEFHNLLRS